MNLAFFPLCLLTISRQHSSSHEYVPPHQFLDVWECVCDVRFLQCHRSPAIHNLTWRDGKLQWAQHRSTATQASVLAYINVKLDSLWMSDHWDAHRHSLKRTGKASFNFIWTVLHKTKNHVSVSINLLSKQVPVRSVKARIRISTRMRIIYCCCNHLRSFDGDS